jgi:trans-aconitate 2-methyltransferase
VPWDPAQYLKYAGERLRPALDLMARVPLAAPRSIVDLGCGAGNVTRLLAERWPGAQVVGVDNSAAMLAKARATGIADARWMEVDLAEWAASAPSGAADLVYSNAALHWLDRHEELFPRLLRTVAPGGALAVQMPSNFGAPSHVALRQTVESARWRTQFAHLLRPTPVAEPARYFAWLAGGGAALDVWTSEYLHVLPPSSDGEHPVVAWTKGTALTPFLSALDAPAGRAFVADYTARVAPAYPPLADGRVLFPFRRLFVVAVRAEHAV